MNETTTHILIENEPAEKRLDKYLSLRFAHSRTYFQYLIENGCVLINGKIVKKRTLLQKNDAIEIFFLPLPEISLQPENIPLDIIYEDEHLLAINKPKNFVVHPAPGNYHHTFVHALLYYIKNHRFSSEDLRPGIVHRLDKDTTGVLLAAKTPLAQQKLIELFAQRKITKNYLAICHGTPPEGEFSAPIGRHPIKRKEMAIIEKGKKALTHIQVIASAPPFSLVLATPKTGRTHQIRVHLRQLKAPIIGDPIYGIEKINHANNIFYPQLHAYSLHFIHPFSQKPLHLKAQPPYCMQQWIEKNFPKDFSISSFFS